jgi:hypothetical protein
LDKPYVDHVIFNTPQFIGNMLGDIPKLERAKQAIIDRLDRINESQGSYILSTGKLLHFPVRCRDEMMLTTYAAAACQTPADQIDGRLVHDLWTLCMALAGKDKPSMVPFDQLPVEVQSWDEPFVDAMRAASTQVNP